MSAIIESLWEHISYLPLKENLKGKSFRLKKWPNFGFSNYQHEFITLAALLAQQELNEKQLRKLTGYQPQHINSFLNAAYLLKLIQVDEQPTRMSDSINHKINAFTQRMRQVFGFEA